MNTPASVTYTAVAGRVGKFLYPSAPGAYQVVMVEFRGAFKMLMFLPECIMPDYVYNNLALFSERHSLYKTNWEGAVVGLVVSAL